MGRGGGRRRSQIGGTGGTEEDQEDGQQDGEQEAGDGTWGGRTRVGKN